MAESRTLCVNNARYFHRFETIELDGGIDFLAWLENQSALPKAYWQSRDHSMEIAACGSLLTLDAPPQFNSGNDSPALFFGGHAFFHRAPPKDKTWSSFPRIAFFLPKFQLVRKEGKVHGIVQSLGGPILESLDPSIAFFSSRSSSLGAQTHHPFSENWQELVADALSQISSDSFSKVVMARRSTLEASDTFHPFELLSRVPAEGAIRFAFQFSDEQAFIGATPERLYRREGAHLFTEALAGTIRREEPKEKLYDDPKQRREFDFVKTSILEALSPLCSELSCEKEDGIIKTPRVQHLYNPFVGKLRPHTSDFDVLQALHPTAAMGGLPKKSALEHLLEHEPFERGWYASPLGFAGQDTAELAVGIRSALVERKKLHLFAGTGIVEGSIPEKEWEELENKTALWKGVLQ